MTTRKKETQEISVWYYARDGKLYFVSENEKDKDGIKHRYERCVPDEVLLKGDEVIKQYVVSEITKKRRIVQRIINQRQKKIRETNFPLRVVNEGVCLEGRIIRYSPQEGPCGIVILLEKPEEYNGKCHSVEGRYSGSSFDEKGDLTKGTIADAERKLVYIYEDKKREVKESEMKKSAPLVSEAAERLNKQRS